VRWTLPDVVIVVATTADAVVRVQARLVELGLDQVSVVAPSATRRLVLAGVDDEWEAERLGAALRADGHIVVTRPSSGVRLDGWMRHTRPMTFGARLSVCFAWSEHQRDDRPGLIELGPGGFGSGEHPSTELVLEQLVDRVHGEEAVLDVGCGSGVLGLAALRLGASRVLAVDIKAAAVDAARRNALLNGMEPRFEATLSPLTEIDGVFDVVVANIGRAGVVDVAPELVRLVGPTGWLAVSGISPAQCSLVTDFLRPLVEVDRRTAGEWAVVVLAHPPS